MSRRRCAPVLPILIQAGKELDFRKQNPHVSRLLFSIAPCNFRCGELRANDAIECSGRDERPVRPRQLLIRPKNLPARDDWTRRWPSLTQLAAQTPEAAGVERLRGIILYQREEFPEAIEAFTKAAAQDPSDQRVD